MLRLQILLHPKFTFTRVILNQFLSFLFLFNHKGYSKLEAGNINDVWEVIAFLTYPVRIEKIKSNNSVFKKGLEREIMLFFVVFLYVYFIK